MSSFIMSIAVLLLAGSGFASVIGWREAATSLGRWCVVAIVLATFVRLPWRALAANAFSSITANTAFDGYGCLIVAGHIALALWLVKVRYFPRFGDDRVRSRQRRGSARPGGAP